MTLFLRGFYDILKSLSRFGTGSNTILWRNYAFSRARVRVVRSQTSLGP